MNNTFNFKRFRKYFSYDLKARWKDQRLFFLTFALFPVLLYLIYMFFSLTGSGLSSMVSGGGLSRPGLEFRLAIFGLASVFFVLLAPSRAYGFITKKDEGAAWLMLPASRLEKFASMMITCLIVIPLAFFCLYLLSDAMIALLDGSYGKSIISAAWMERDSLFNSGWNSGDNLQSTYRAGGLWMIIAQILQVSSTFLLGALLFKKLKVTKTILSLFAISMVLFAVCAICAKTIDLSGDICALDSKLLRFGEHFNLWFNLFVNLWLAIVVIGLGTLSWFRLKNLQH